MQDCYKSVANEMVVNDGDVPVYEVVVKFQHTELGVLVYEEPDVMRQVIRHACLTRRHLVCIVGHNIQLAEPLVADEPRCADLRAIPDIPMFIHICHRLAVGRITEQLHGVGDDALVGIDVSIASGRGNGFTKVLEAWLR